MCCLREITNANHNNKCVLAVEEYHANVDSRNGFDLHVA